MLEQWREIPGSNGRYIVSSNGRVATSYGHGKCSKKRDNKIPEGYYLMSQKATSWGYNQVYLVLNGKRTSRAVHRLVMEAFVGKSDKEVNHINEDKLDNRLTNLEYISSGANHLHSYARPVERIDPESGRVEAIYSSLKAAKDDGYYATSILQSCNGEIETYKGYLWRYHDEFKRFAMREIKS